MNPLRIGLRSALRSRRRTLVTTGAMSLAGAIMIIYAALMDGLTATLERNAVALDLGEAQSHAPGYRRDPDLYTVIEDPEALGAAAENLGMAWAPRLRAFGLVSAGVPSAGVELRGVDLEREPETTELHEHVQDGAWLSPRDTHGVVLGRKLARTLRVSVGDELVFVGQAADGSTANELFRIRGILGSVGDAVDRTGLYLPAPSFRELMVLPRGVHEIVYRVREGDLSSRVEALAAAQPSLETLSWRQLQPALAGVIDSSAASSLIMQLITYAAIAMVVLNATLMTVFERIREFGIMKALGVGPFGVAAIVASEVGVQVGAACVLSLVVGAPVALFLSRTGIDLSAMMSTTSVSGVAIDPIWYAEMSPETILGPLVTLALLAFLASLYPGLKAAALRPLDALRHR